ncbi:MAG: NHLP leader peptide family RiPP precursor [Anaerolineae bacterium]|nr:NHLP leader peptide family RiPP precursor [Anaerolineae bacterium]
MAEETPKRTREGVETELAVKAWNDPAFMQELKADPKAVLAKEYGVQIPDSVDVKVIEETPTSLYLRLPPNPSDLELSDEQLELVAGGECVVSTTIISAVISGTITTVSAVSQRVSERHGGW